VRGLRFADIANRLAITRAKVHYHFGAETNLVDAVIDDYL
jgi:AcrR family transcriptional regulator